MRAAAEVASIWALACIADAFVIARVAGAADVTPATHSTTASYSATTAGIAACISAAAAPSRAIAVPTGRRTATRGAAGLASRHATTRTAGNVAATTAVVPVKSSITERLIHVRHARTERASGGDIAVEPAQGLRSDSAPAHLCAADDVQAAVAVQ